MQHLQETGGRGSPIPELVTHHSPLITRHCSQVLCFHTLAHSFALFCIGAKLNPFLSNRFRTLCSKTRGGGVCLTSLLRYLLTSLPPATATLFPYTTLFRSSASRDSRR